MRSNCREAILFNPNPAAYIPHRPPFLFIDTVTALERGVAATGEYAVSGGGYFPPLLLVEAMAQISGIAAGQQEGEGGVLAALSRVELPPSVAPEARLVVSSRVVKVFGRLIQVEGEVRQDGIPIATAALTLAIG
jgi:3-hydroxyacyl-[acyl-carrier-protein] dehydratase